MSKASPEDPVGDTFLKLYKVYVRPHLEYAVASWSPWTVGNKEVLEKVQRRVLGMVCIIRNTVIQAGRN